MVGGGERGWCREYHHQSLFFRTLLYLNRSNVFYQWQVNRRNKSFRIFCPKKPITVPPKVICGFQSFLGLHRINLLVFNDALAVLSYCSLPCFSTFSITISPLKQTRIRLAVIYRSVLSTSLLNRFHAISLLHPSHLII
jgi:hypothetical protein